MVMASNYLFSPTQEQRLIAILIESCLEYQRLIADTLKFEINESENIDTVLDWAGLSVFLQLNGWFVGDLNKPRNQLSSIFETRNKAMIQALEWIRDCFYNTGDIDVRSWLKGVS